MWQILIFLLGLAVLGMPIAVIVLFSHVRQIRQEVIKLKSQVASLQGEPSTEPAPKASPPQARAVTPEVVKVETPRPVPESKPEPAPVRPARVATPAAEKVDFGALFESLKAANWLILAGGVVLAFGIVFLIKYSIDEGLLGPLARVTLGALLGFVFLALGEMARHRSLGRISSVLKEDALPPTLTGAGVLALFTSCYGAYALYDLLPPMAAFVLLAIIAFGALALSFWHGPIIASLGVAGAFAVPALIQSTDPTALAFFTYLTVVTVTALVIARFKDWFWLALSALIGAGLWQMHSLTALASGLDIRPATLGFAAAMTLSFAGLIGALEMKDKRSQYSRLRLDFVGAGGFALAAFVIFQMHTPGGFELIAASVVLLGLLGLAHRSADKFALLPIAGIFALLCLAGWRFEGLGYTLQMSAFDSDVLGLEPLVPPQFLPLLLASGANFMLFVMAGLIHRTARWATAATAFALLTLVNAYARINGFHTSLSWGAIGLAAAIVFLLGAGRLRKQTDDASRDPILAAYAVGVLGALALAFAMTLERAWLSVALALLIPATGWVFLRIHVELLRRAAFVLALLVFARLLLNPFALEYPLDPPYWLNWMQYGFGIPALAFYFAARWFQRDQRDLLTDVLQVGVLAFVLVLTLSQVRLFIHGGDLTSAHYLLSEASVNTLTWFAFAYGLGRSRLIETSPVLLKACQLLYLLAVAHLVWFQILAFNPIISNEPVGTYFLVNLLGLAYLAPIGFIVLILAGPEHSVIQRHLGQRTAPLLGLAAYVLGLLYVTLEVRHMFHGTRLNDGMETDTELYTYSLVWVLYAAGLMGVGIWRNLQPLRMASLATIALATLKIFLLDMDELEGLLRVFSFFGLAFSLLGVGYLYQRFVVVAPKKEGGDQAPPS